MGREEWDVLRDWLFELLNDQQSKSGADKLEAYPTV
jgi:hypothetical protein